jgi:RNA ligase (TIGR02306 family)
MRKMASIRRIDGVKPIQDADAIECATVGGWQVVIKKGEFSAGDFAVYCEIDSWIPNELAPFLSKGQEPREYNGVRGERLRTVKLRGQVSQGLLLPLTVLTDAPENTWGNPVEYVEGDVSEILNIQKWEAPIPAQLAGDVEGPFPSYIPKTDQERIQNLSEEFASWQESVDMPWEVSEKLDGSSMTVYFKDGKFGVCSRNWALKETEGNSLWKQARHYNMESMLANEGNFAVQGELIGEGIQGNPYKIRGQDFYVYDIYDINEQRYLSPEERRTFVERNGLKHVPVIAHNAKLHDTLGIDTIEQILKFAEGKSVLNANAEREGLVFKHNGLASFKAISNRFLLKNG